MTQTTESFVDVVTPDESTVTLRLRISWEPLYRGDKVPGNMHDRTVIAWVPTDFETLPQ